MEVTCGGEIAPVSLRWIAPLSALDCKGRKYQVTKANLSHLMNVQHVMLTPILDPVRCIYFFYLYLHVSFSNYVNVIVGIHRNQVSDLKSENHIPQTFITHQHYHTAFIAWPTTSELPQIAS